ncbi:MAG: sigma 54-interacting transcriptional regulator, partial [Bryobacteraceae bacterium]
ELAHGGTLLLDEIGEMPLATQAKLLRVLEERRVRRLGGAREIDVDVRVIAASNRRLDDEVRAGRFREDLYFRLHVFEIRMPPLRERLDDLPLLCEAMIAELNQRHQCRVTGVSPDALEWLRQQGWPGNVRQLRNALERAVILAGVGPLGRQHFESSALSSSRLDTAPVAANEVRLPIGTTVDEAERALIEATLRYTNNNRTRAAAILGISQKTLFNKLREYGAEQAGE